MSSRQAAGVDACIRLQSVKNVAIIGAGISGIVSAAHLLRAGIDVIILDRAQDLEVPEHIVRSQIGMRSFPSIKPPSYVRPKLGKKRKRLATKEIVSSFAPPGPVNTSLKSRGSSNII